MNESAVTSYNWVLRDNPTVENYLHEAELVAVAPSGTVYTDGHNNTIANLVVHEQRYSRNLGNNEGIKLNFLSGNS